MIKCIDNVIQTLKLNKNKIFDYYLIILICSIIIFSRNTLISSCFIGFKISFIISALLFIPMFIITLKKLIQKQIDLKKLIEVFIMVVAMIISMILKKDMQFYNFSILYYIASSIILILAVDFKKIQKYYINIMFVISIFSLITTYLIKPIIFKFGLENAIKNTCFVVTNPSNYYFLNLGLGFALLNKSYDRNYGIFNEPSFFQFYLIISIVMIAFLENKRNIDWIKIIIFIFTLYTTKSAVGIIVLAFVIATYLLKYVIENKKDYKTIFKMLICIIIICSILLCIPKIRNNINIIYEKITTKNESSMSRFGSIEYTIRNFINSPIIGNKISDILQYEHDLTNTIFTIGAVYGIIPFLCVLYFTAKLALKFKEKKFISFCIFIIFMLASNSHLFIGIHSFWMIILLSFGEVKNENTLDS